MITGQDRTDHQSRSRLYVFTGDKKEVATIIFFFKKIISETGNLRKQTNTTILLSLKLLEFWSCLRELLYSCSY